MKKFKITCETKKAYKQVMKSLDNLQEMFEVGTYIGQGEKDNPDKDYKLKYKQEEKMYPVIVKANFKYVSDLRALIQNDLLSREKDVTFAICEDTPVPEYVVDEPDYPAPEYDSDDGDYEDEEVSADYESEEEEFESESTEETADEDLPEWQRRIIRKLENGERLADVELKEMVWNLPQVAENKSSDLDRWTRSVETIVELNNKLYRIMWDQGLTEMQEDEFYNQPEEVKPYPVEEVVQTTLYLTDEEKTGYELDSNAQWITPPDMEAPDEEEELDF